MISSKLDMLAWRAGSVVRSKDRSSKGPGFNFQNACGSAEPPVALVTESSVLFRPMLALYALMVHRHACRQNSVYIKE